jgi:DNA-binding MarR family transcriptional regulator
MPEKRISFLLNTVVREMNSHADSLLRHEFGITYSQFFFLMITSEHPSIDVTRLADELGVTKGAVSKRVSWFVERGFATAEHPPGDSKRIQISLTRQGKQLADNAGSFLERTFMSTISQDHETDYGVLSTELAKILDALIQRRSG